MRIPIAFIPALALAAACAAPPSSSQPAGATPGAVSWPAGTLVDLSHAYDAQSVYWPTADRFKLDSVADGVTPAGYY